MADLKTAAKNVEDKAKGLVDKVEAELKDVVEKVEHAAIAFVQMFRDPEIHPEPHAATVHPDEVNNFKVGGWVTEDEMHAQIEAQAKAQAAAAEPQAPADSAAK